MGLAIRGKLLFLAAIVILLNCFIVARFRPTLSTFTTSSTFISPLGQKAGGPLDQYSFENLQKRKYPGGNIKLDKIIKKGINFTSYLFFYESDGKKISGLLNLPVGDGPFPVVVLLRGYVDQEIYYTGLGTQKVGEALAEKGYLTLAPDFLGYGSSDPVLSQDILEDRFEKPIEVLNLLSSIKTLSCVEKNSPQPPDGHRGGGNLPSPERRGQGEVNRFCVDPDKVFMWAHSNGGQIALSVLEITQEKIPTVLWAPVSKGFPEALTVYMHVLDDQGKKVKAAIDQFAKNYDPTKYSIITYLKDLNSPLEIHQGTADDLVSVSWSDEFVAQLKSLGKKVEYFTYPGADHNLSGSVWQTAVSRSLDFFNKN